MRQQLKFHVSTLPKLLIRRTYSSKSSPLINITDVKAPTGGGRIRILSLARPSARNAISRQLLWELRSHIDAVAGEYDSNGDEVAPPQRFGGAAGVDERGPTRALILASDVDSCFCAGADLKERAGFTAEEYVFVQSFIYLSYSAETKLNPGRKEYPASVSGPSSLGQLMLLLVLQILIIQESQ